jgi:hypothetical protein
MNNKHGMRGVRDTRGQVKAEKEFHRKYLERQKRQQKKTHEAKAPNHDGRAGSPS